MRSASSNRNVDSSIANVAWTKRAVASPARIDAVIYASLMSVSTQILDIYKKKQNLNNFAKKFKFEKIRILDVPK
jgi:hypothetical protein